MKYKNINGLMMQLLVIALIAVPAPEVKAADVNPVEWDFSLETYGTDTSWTSSTNIPIGHPQYEYNLQLDYVDFKVPVLGWYDVLTHMDTQSASGTAYGIPFNIADFNIDITLDVLGVDYEVFSAHFNGGVDGEGYGFADMTDVSLGDYLIYSVEGFRCGGTIMVTAVPEPATICLLGLGGLLLRRKPCV